jgi:hypothetical protein
VPAGNPSKLHAAASADARSTQCRLACAPRLPAPLQLAACISGNDVLQDLAQLTDMIADILWCS